MGKVVTDPEKVVVKLEKAGAEQEKVDANPRKVVAALEKDDRKFGVDPGEVFAEPGKAAGVEKDDAESGQVAADPENTPRHQEKDNDELSHAIDKSGHVHDVQ